MRRRARGGMRLAQQALGCQWDGSVGVDVRRTRACGDGEAADEEERSRRSRLLHDVSAARAVVEVVLEASCLQASLFVCSTCGVRHAMTKQKVPRREAAAQTRAMSVWDCFVTHGCYLIASETD